jgi:excisionase family DNA binding protein
MNSTQRDERITTQEAAEILGVKPSRVRRMISNGDIKDVQKFGQNNSLSKSEIEQLKLSRSTKPTGRPPKDKTK